MPFSLPFGCYYGDTVKNTIKTVGNDFEVVKDAEGETVKFVLDPNNLPTLTSEEEARLDAASIDYTDIPELPDSFWQPKEKSDEQG